MKAMFGVVSLLVALAIVGLVAVRQLKAVGHVGAAPAGSPEAALLPQLSGSGNVAQQSRQLQEKVADDVAKAMNQAAAARKEEADKP